MEFMTQIRMHLWRFEMEEYTKPVFEVSRKGIDGNPGGIEGIIVYNRYNVLGKIDKNTDCGIFGTLDRTENLFQENGSDTGMQRMK